MFELIYYSVASPSLDRNDISDILKTSQVNNSKNDITGCMLYHNDAFLQILEGDQKIVELLYSKISQDQRHYNIRLVYDDSKSERLFKKWSMAFLDLDNDNKIDENKLIFRQNFTTISKETEHSTIASQLFWDISRQIILE